MKLEYAVPWTNESYMACNGFHPLYSPMFEDMESDERQYNILDESSFAKSITSTPQKIKAIGEDVDNYFEKNLTNHAGNFYFKRILEYIGAEDLWVMNNIPGDIEIHHTAPLSSCERPFVFHCESFLPIFIPFSYQGQGKIDNVSAIKNCYRSIFLNENCLGISSHLPKTLKEISRFFESDTIDAKLFSTRIALPTSTFEKLSSEKKSDIDNPIFLFTGSFHQSPLAFKGRGGISVLIFAKQFILHAGKGLFIFRCARPNDEDLETFGIDLEWLRISEKNGHLLWITGITTDQEQLNLFKAAHFFLLPSLNLHSVSIMQAQASGAVPIVTDSIGVDRFVADAKTGIVLNGVADQVWRKDEQHKYSYDDHNLWTIELACSLADQMFFRICNLLDDTAEFHRISQSIQTYAKNEYDGKAFRDDFFSEVSLRYENFTSDSAKRHLYVLPLMISQEQVTNIFSSPPVANMYMDIQSHSYFVFKGMYWAILKTEINHIKKWSLLTLARAGMLDNKTLSIASSFNDFDTNLLLPLCEDKQSNPTTEYLEDIRELSESHPILERLLKNIYPYIRSYLVELEREVAKHTENDPRKFEKWKRLLKKIPLAFSTVKYAHRTFRELYTLYPSVRCIVNILKKFFGKCSVIYKILICWVKILYRRIIKHNYNRSIETRNSIINGKFVKGLNRYPKLIEFLSKKKKVLRRICDKYKIINFTLKCFWWMTLLIVSIIKHTVLGLILLLDFTIITLKLFNLFLKKLSF